jgi:hypothetical protein
MEKLCQQLKPPLPPAQQTPGRPETDPSIRFASATSPPRFLRIPARRAPSIQSKLERGYKEVETWKNTDSLGRDDLLVAAKALDKAHDRIIELQQEGRG